MVGFIFMKAKIDISTLAIKVVVHAEMLPRDFLQTPGNYYL